MVEVTDEDCVEKPDTEGDLSKSGGEGPPLGTDPLEQDDKTHDVGSNAPGGDDHVADGEHQIVDGEGTDDLSS